MPFLRETWVVSFRGRMQSTLGDDDLVPYFLMPQLGSGRTLRAYSDADAGATATALLTNSGVSLDPEPARAGHGALLRCRQGRAAASADLDSSDWNSNWGIGARFHGPTSTVLRIEAAHGVEGWNVVFATSAAF